jgi:hydrogenase nickel incorporation protein HypA/HybF
MHELSIALSIIEGAEEEVQRQGGCLKCGRVCAVHLKLGPLSGVVRDALLFSWELACEGTSLQGSDLIIDETSGAELELTALELETTETPA